MDSSMSTMESLELRWPWIWRCDGQEMQGELRGTDCLAFFGKIESRCGHVIVEASHVILFIRALEDGD